MAKIIFPNLVGSGKVPPTVTYYTTTSKDKDVKRSKKMNYWEYNGHPAVTKDAESKALISFLFDSQHCDTLQDMQFGCIQIKPENERFDNCENRIYNKTFINCHFYCVDFSGLDFIDCKFDNCAFICCTFISTSFIRTKVTQSLLGNCCLSLCKIVESEFLYDIIRTCTVSHFDIDYTTSFKDTKFDFGTSVESEQFRYVSILNRPIFDATIPQNVKLYGWKAAKAKIGACEQYVIVKLEIPADAERVRPSGQPKCRCEKAKVIGIESLSGKKQYKNVTCVSIYDNHFQYELGCIIKPRIYPAPFPSGGYDNNPFCSCSGGVHFFLSREDALKYVNDIIETKRLQRA